MISFVDVMVSVDCVWMTSVMSAGGGVLIRFASSGDVATFWFAAVFVGLIRIDETTSGGRDIFLVVVSYTEPFGRCSLFVKFIDSWIVCCSCSGTGVVVVDVVVAGAVVVEVVVGVVVVDVVASWVVV